MAGGTPDASLAETIALLWTDHSRPVGRTGRSINDFVAAATELARASGLEALSMRAIAERLGVRTMATYNFAPGKAALLALMVDHAYRDLYPTGAIPAADAWRARLKRVAKANRELFLANSWLHAACRARSLMGPHELAKYEVELAALEKIGLTDVEMDQTLAAILNHAAHISALESQLLVERRGSGLEDPQWWVEVMPQLERYADARRFPLTARVGRAATAARDGEFWGEEAFNFGLERLLDGIEVLIRSR